jgi:hypothetical protein
MRAIRFAASLASCLCLMLVSATAEVVVRQEGGPEPGYTNITISHTITVPVKADTDPLSQQTETLRSFYNLVGRTCRTTLETIAETCEITNINFTLRSSDDVRLNRLDRPKTTSIDARIQVLVKLKADVGPPSRENAARRYDPAGRF